MVMIMGQQDDWKKSLQKNGFQIKTMNHKPDKNQFDVEGVPALLVYDSKGDIKYSGGYYECVISHESQVKDVAIIAAIQNGKSLPDMPIYGCTVSEEYKKILDPLNLK